MNEEIKNQVLEWIKERVEVPEVYSHYTLHGLGLDSLDAVEIELEMEHKYNIRMPLEEVGRIQDMTVDQVVEYIQKLTEESS